ncbi:hypothetical protein KL921_002806 [Ogataea angusta]|uniref:MHD domain-containing protein n=1 Tax=Pichia angusta TaxID=870730 RepID=A0AAN6DE62_PICAN|nr:uncharacterized protein KL928_003042 [Ogataea angusta]KAG7810311.1 hypothetical protein KL921_002806 [Ogataea angusta]KAG7818041.1 hypothetical protein KL928_003042 [Ogataea angusta]KAG7834251.1 hypothetical protein KL943_003547 [Ogataea angusta]KAG7839862.1 hypothetical protein KL942_002661 [Ogataea angusta]KAG7846521.1 hypothetical protein KL940_004119 [Ogataea angusta]
MASAIYVLDLELNIIIQRQYKNDLNSQSIIEYFKRAQTRSQSPVVSFNGAHFAYTRCDDIYLMSPIFDDLNIACLMSFLSKTGVLLGQYMNQRITSEAIRDNYILVYELFDEVLDYGIPQLTDFNILKEYINAGSGGEDINSSISRTSTNNISWRPKGIFYSKNEIFINFTESIKFKYSFNTRRIVLNSIDGEVECKCYLSGMPILKMGMNETFSRDGKLEEMVFSNLNFHQSVTLSHVQDFITFLPPDGTFKLFSYQISNTARLKPLIMIRPKFKIYKKYDIYKLRITVEIKTSFKKRYSLRDVKTHIPLVIPLRSLKVNFNKPLRFKTKLGSVVYNIEKNCITWMIPKLEGNSRGEMQSELELLKYDTIDRQHKSNVHLLKQDKNDLIYYDLDEEFKVLDSSDSSDVKPASSINIEFDLISALYSDLKVTYLKIEEPQFKFQSFPWVKYTVSCRNEDYSFTLSDDLFDIDLNRDEIREVGDFCSGMQNRVTTEMSFSNSDKHFDEVEASERSQSMQSKTREPIVNSEEYMIEEDTLSIRTGFSTSREGTLFEVLEQDDSQRNRDT